MKQYKKHIIIVLGLLFLLFGCMQDNLTQDNYILEGTWVVLNEDTTINKQITFTDLDFTDETQTTRPFRVDNTRKVIFVMQDNKIEIQFPFTLVGDNLTFDGIEYIKYDSLTYNQILEDYQNYLVLKEEKAKWDEKNVPLRNNLLQAYQNANRRINDSLRDFLVTPAYNLDWDGGDWSGKYNNDCYDISLRPDGSLFFLWSEVNRHPGYPECTRENESYINANFSISQQTFKLSDYITDGKINEKFDIPLNDNGAITNIENEINRLNQLDFNTFIKNSTLLLTPNWKNEPVSIVTTILINSTSDQYFDDGFKLSSIQINNIDPDLNQMLITVNHGKGNRSFIVHNI